MFRIQHCWKCIFVITLMMIVASLEAQIPPKFPSKIEAVTAKLYFLETGEFSGNILGMPDGGLWNTIIGEGAAKSPSNAVLIEVEVDGDGRENVAHHERLTITVKAEGKPPIIRRNDSFLYGRTGKHFEAVWLYDAGCLPVTITAQLDDQPIVKKKIDFDCGE
jgi:hypothetical protein